MPSFKKQDYISKIYIPQLYKMQEKLFKIETSKTDVSKTIREKKIHCLLVLFFLCVYVIENMN